MASPFGRGSNTRTRVSAPERDAADEERVSASLGYLFWPLALPILLDTAQRPRSPWLRQHAKQAAVFGICTWSILLILFSLPLIALMAGLVPFSATLALYGAAFFLDLVAVGLSFAVAVIAARKAARGERFAIREFLPIAKKDLT
jgi:uncharacterized Tic20 family protein